MTSLENVFTCVEPESFMQAVFRVSTRDWQTSTNAVHVSHCKPDVLELVHSFHVEGLVIIIVRFTMLLLLLLLTSSSHLYQPVHCRRVISSTVPYVASRLYVYTGLNAGARFSSPFRSPFQLWSSSDGGRQAASITIYDGVGNEVIDHF